MSNELLNFWNEAQLSAAPFVHPRDHIPPAKIQPGIVSYADFIAEFEGGALSSAAFHLGLLPQPYHGDLDNAEIVLLLINPGLAPGDYYVEGKYPEYRNELIATLRQDLREHMFLNPKWAWTSGFAWWERKMRDVARIIASERFAGHYGKALLDLSRRIAAIELVPYHSFSFGGFVSLASSNAARGFATSIEESRTIIATRRVSDWGLPDANNVIKYASANARSASLSSKSPGGRAILARYGIVVPVTE